MIFENSALRRSRIGRGVAAGAKTASIESVTTSRPASRIVGTSGKRPDRLTVVTASTRILPASTCGRPPAVSVNMTGSLPPRKSVVASTWPLYGTLRIGTPARWPNISPVTSTLDCQNGNASFPGFALP